MTRYLIDTNAGPVPTIEARDPDAVRRYMERRIPLLQNAGYTATWSTSETGWHVIAVHNSRGKVVHRAAFRRVTADEPNLYRRA